MSLNERNKFFGLGAKKHDAVICTDLNAKLSQAIRGMEFDNIQRYKRLLFEKSCRIPLKSQIFLDKHRSG